MGIGIAQADADAVLSAVADAYVHVQLDKTGVIPASYGYTMPATPYVFANSQRRVIGPQ